MAETSSVAPAAMLIWAVLLMEPVAAEWSVCRALMDGIAGVAIGAVAPKVKLPLPLIVRLPPELMIAPENVVVEFC